MLEGFSLLLWLKKLLTLPYRWGNRWLTKRFQQVVNFDDVIIDLYDRFVGQVQAACLVYKNDQHYQNWRRLLRQIPATLNRTILEDRRYQRLDVVAKENLHQRIQTFLYDKATGGDLVRITETRYYDWDKMREEIANTLEQSLTPLDRISR